MSLQNHEFCIIDNVEELMDRGYRCFLEFELDVPENLQSYYERKKAVIDIYAVKNNKEIFVEVGTLSQCSIWWGRIELIKKLRPKAKVVHVHQWKNYFTVDDFQNAKLLYLALRYAWKHGHLEVYYRISKGHIQDGQLAAMYAQHPNYMNEIGISFITEE